MLLVVPAKVKKAAKSEAVEGIAEESVEFVVGVMVFGRAGVTAIGVADGVLQIYQYIPLVETSNFALTLLKYHYPHPRRRYHHHD